MPPELRPTRSVRVYQPAPNPGGMVLPASTGRLGGPRCRPRRDGDGERPGKVGRLTRSPGDPGYEERRIGPADWPDAIATTEGPQLVVAGPGAGKTEFLVRRIAHLVNESLSPASGILALTFSRRAAADLRTRLSHATRDPVGGLGASTFHSFAYRLLELYAPNALGWTTMPTILTGPEQVELISQLLATDPARHWPLPFRNLLGARTLADEVTEFILRVREMMLDPAELRRRSAERDDWRALPRFVERYDEVIEGLNRIDYGTLLSRAVEVLEDRTSLEEVRAQYRYVLVDEYQDTTPAQATLLRAVTERSGNLTAAADPYQSIYAFRGAVLSNVTEFSEGMDGPGWDRVRKWVLGVSFRVPTEILRTAERLTVGVELPGAAGPVDPAPHSGRVDLRVFDQESEESEWIAAEAARLHLEQEIPYRRMAVLVRTKRRLLKELSRALERRSIPHDRPDVRLVDHPAARMIFDLARSATAPDRPTAGPPLRRLLLGPLFDLGIGSLRQLERDLRSSDMTWAGMIRREVEGGQALALLLENASWTNRPAVDAFWHAWTYLPQFRPMVTDPGRGEFRAAWASLAQTLVRVFERNPATTLVDYMRLVESDDFEARPLLSYRDSSEDRMVLTTLHQAKGLEFDIVFIADAVEGVLPDLRRHQSLLQTEQLDADGSGACNATRRRIQEETRLMYTAMTRARRMVVVTATSAGLDEQHHRPSRFLDVIAGDELVIASAAPRTRRPITVREAESWLRTILADPAEPGHRRLGAARVLAAGTHPGLRSPWTYAAIRRAGADAGLLAAGRRLSPSDALNYDACAREFAFQRLLKVNLPAGPYLTFGNLIHDVLEQVERQAASEDRRSALDEALACLDEVFPDYDLGVGSLGEAWRRRAAQLLNRLYAEWPNPDAVPLLLEHGVETELGGAIWRGRIDRIEQNPDGTLRIVDYKTGKTPPPVREVSRSLQLGFYSLAADLDDTVSVHGPVCQAEFWYPLANSPKRRVASFDQAQLDETRSRLADIAGMIAREDWTPKPGNACRRCEVKLVCPAWPEGQEAYRR